MPSRIDDALDGFSARELETLRTKIDQRLQSCLVCGADGASPVRAEQPETGARISLMLCPACVERNRLPESRAPKGRPSESGR
jgi:hypothetical protein